MSETLIIVLSIFATSVCSFILILFSKNVKASIIIAPIIVEAIVMLHSYIKYAAISQFGILPYLVAFPFLLIGSVLGSLVWIYIFKKDINSNVKPKETD